MNVVTVREPIYAALFSLVAELVNEGGARIFRISGRKLVHWDEVASELMPALFLTQGDQQPRPQRRGLPTQWELSAKFYIYVSTSAQQQAEAVPAQAMNRILDAVVSAFPTGESDQSEGVVTLGGLVSHCWIEGAIETSEGYFGDLEVATVPVKMLVK